jgi:hypothetical protein
MTLSLSFSSRHFLSNWSQHYSSQSLLITNQGHLGIENSGWKHRLNPNSNTTQTAQSPHFPPPLSPLSSSDSFFFPLFIANWSQLSKLTILILATPIGSFTTTSAYPWPSNTMKSPDFFKPRETHTIAPYKSRFSSSSVRSTNDVKQIQSLCVQKTTKKHLRMQSKTSCKNLEIRSEEQSCKAPEIKTLPKLT